MSVHAFSQLSKHLHKYLIHEPTPYAEFIKQSVYSAQIHNPWFIERFIHTMFQHIVQLTDQNILESYTIDMKPPKQPKKVLVIAAGNIPMVSFKDVMDVLLSGHILVFKPSSKDTVLMKMLLSLLKQFDPTLAEKIIICESIISSKEIDAVIATGTNNTTMYIHHYFQHLPRIVRNNRTSLAIIDNSTTDEDLKKLSDDILLYFGLGCRNVSKLFLSQNFDIQRLFNALLDYSFVMHHHKYMNNYDYYRTIYLLNHESFLENHFIILKESTNLHAPVANVFYEYYSDEQTIYRYIQTHKNDIQTIVSKNHTPFGKSQFPNIDDWADGIHTKNFLIEL